MDKFKYTVGASMALVMTALMAGVAGAQTAPVDPTGGAADDLQEQATAWITGEGVPLIVAFLVIGTVVGLLVKFAKRGKGAA